MQETASFAAVLRESRILGRGDDAKAGALSTSFRGTAGNFATRALETHTTRARFGGLFEAQGTHDNAAPWGIF